MTVIKLCGIAIIGVVAILIIRVAKSEFAVPLGILTGVIILTSAVATLYPIVSYVQEISEGNAFSVYYTTILKALGIGILSQSAVDICRDSGENAIASKLEFAAKAGILLLGLPIIKELLAMTSEILG